MRIHIIPNNGDRTLYSKLLGDIFSYAYFCPNIGPVIPITIKKQEENIPSKLEACVETLQDRAHALTATVPIELKGDIIDISHIAKAATITSSTKVDAVFLLGGPVKEVDRNGFLYYNLTDDKMNNANTMHLLQTIQPKARSSQHKHMHAKETHIGLYGKSFEVTDNQSRYLDIGNVSVKEQGVAHMICNPLNVSARNLIVLQGLDEKTTTKNLKWPQSIDKLFN